VATAQPWEEMEIACTVCKFDQKLIFMGILFTIQQIK
jgi:hypothetical protein